MPQFNIPVRKEVPAYGEVVVEADSLEAACNQVQADIEANGEESLAAEAEFTTDWSEAYDLRLADIALPDGRNFSAKP